MGKVTVVGGKVGVEIPVKGIRARNFSVGSTVNLLENGNAVEYLVVNQGIPSNSSLYDASCNGTWLLRKTCLTSAVWRSSSANNNYVSSNADQLCNTTLISYFDEATKNAIKTAKIPCVNGTGSTGSVVSGENGLARKSFLLSGLEIGWIDDMNNTSWDWSILPHDGARLDYFLEGSSTEAQNRRIATYNGSNYTWYLRSPQLKTNEQVFNVYETGLYSGGRPDVSYGIRPALILDSDAVFNKDTLVLEGVA